MTTTRRTFLQRAGGLAIAGVCPALWARVGYAAPAERILLVLQLSGGHDGLSALVPYEDDALGRARKTTAIPRTEVLPLEADLGLHPRLGAWKRLWDAGHLAVVPGVGYPNPNRSHFTSMDIWHTASPEGRRVGTGWLGRALDEMGGGRAPETGVNVGRTLPYALENVRHPAVTMESAATYRWMGRESELEAFEALNGPVAGDGHVPGTEAWLHETARDALASSRRIRRAVASFTPGAKYPTRGSLGRDLSLVAALAASGLSTRIAYVTVGGYDTHTGQRNRHDQLMRDLGDGTGAFLADLDAHGVADRVVVMVFSEFGRRVKENGSGGTDHGTAGPVFLLGRGVRGGIHAPHPSLTDLDRNGDLKMTCDFRRVYATLLDGWLGVDAGQVLGRPWPGLPLLA